MATINSWGSDDPAEVSKGGSGRSSHDAYAVICGGVTTTADQQSVDSLGDPGAVLTSNGPDILPSFQATPSGSGNWTLIETQTVSSPVSSVDFETGIDSTYDFYAMIINSVIPDDDAEILQLRVGIGVTPTYPSGGTDYAWSTQVQGSGAGSGGIGDTKINLCSGLGSGVDESGISAQMWIMQPSDTGLFTNITWTGGYIGAGDSVDSDCVQGSGKYTAKTAVTALRFFFSLGNIEAGTFALYGVNK